MELALFEISAAHILVTVLTVEDLSECKNLVIDFFPSHLPLGFEEHNEFVLFERSISDVSDLHRPVVVDEDLLPVA